ncbi:hypothetical protein [Motiliproteus sp. SC1-56]|uniref:hypothetical protein n=1 Tax=Motiliproteus sp. SC1-56 TaxID=2799565 RepID=UPI001A8E725F|nr:hypothetical protein [Motiliproteus sp. SC1-56]
MKRLYYLADELSALGPLGDDLQTAGVTHWHYHVLSRDEQGLYRHHIHSVNPIQRRDIVHCGEQGALIGAGAGIALGSLLLLLNPPGFPMDLKMFAVISLTCCLLGIWIGSFGGVRHENYKLARFHKAVEAGRHLVMIDIRRHQEVQVKALLERHYPGLQPAGEGSSFSNPLQDQES